MTDNPLAMEIANQLRSNNPELKDLDEDELEDLAEMMLEDRGLIGDDE